MTETRRQWDRFSAFGLVCSRLSRDEYLVLNPKHLVASLSPFPFLQPFPFHACSLCLPIPSLKHTPSIPSIPFYPIPLLWPSPSHSMVGQPVRGAFLAWRHTGNPTVSTHIPWKAPPLPSASLSRDYEATFLVLFMATNREVKIFWSWLRAAGTLHKIPQHVVPVLTQQTVTQMSKVTFPFLAAIFATCPEVQG